MLSNPTPQSNLHLRQRLHRRQNSTPTAFEAVKIEAQPNSPNLHQPRPRHGVSHRRGLSLDTRRQQLSPSTARTTVGQDFTTVSTTTTTNTKGLATHPQQVLRESQQQRAVRPGLRTPRNFDVQNTQDGENYLLSPQGTPHSQRFHSFVPQGANVPVSSQDFSDYLGKMNVDLKRQQFDFIANSASIGSESFGLFSSDSALSTPTYLTFADDLPSATSQQGWLSEGETTSTRRTSRRISNGILDRVAKFETMTMDAARPVTPPPQNAQEYFPPTPSETPHDRYEKSDAFRPNRFSEGYDESMEETIRPGKGNRNSNRNSGIFDDLRQQIDAHASQRDAAPPAQSNTFSADQASLDAQVPTNLLNLAPDTSTFVDVEGNFRVLSYTQGPVTHSPGTSHHPSPLTPQTSGFPPLAPRPDLAPRLPGDADNPESPHASSSRKGSPHRRTESLASIVSAASIADLDLNMAKTDTGVSQGIIDSYVAGPDAENKYTCTFEDCHKKFGRKENIKSHIQTHLNDRQFECPICNNRFVRQHDLKRHAKIHTGCKPYECACGCTFARHDALTRHRQRGMCVGAFEGIVRKVVKRGRPRKVRPGMDERVEKSARTRVKNRIKAETSSASSQSGYSDSSAANSPGNDFDDAMDMELMDVDVYDQLLRSMPATVGLDSAGLTATAASMAPEEILAVLSPEHAVSPSAFSQHSPASHVSLAEIQENMARHGSHPASPAKSVASHYTHQPSTPPELSLSSSPPGARFGDHEHNSSGFVDPDSSLIMITSATNGLALTSTAPAGLANTSLDDEMLMKAFTNEDAQGLVQIGGQPSEYEMSMGMNMTMFDDDPYFINA